MSKPTHVALFAGLGGFITAANRAGFKTIYANDIESSCCKTLKRSFVDVHVCNKSITEISPNTEHVLNQKVDLLSAGFPCQSFSAAGENLGFDDPRGQLFFEIIRFCKEITSPPKVVLLENVSNLKHYNNGSRLSVVLQHLRSAGYWVNEKNALILNSKDVCGSAQNRERLYVVAYHSKYFKKNYFESTLSGFDQERGLWDIVDRSIRADANYYLPEDSKYWNLVKDAAEQHGSQRLFQLRRTFVRACSEGTCPTLTANMGGGGHNIPFVLDNFGIRKLTEYECLALQGYEDGDVSFPEDVNRSAKYTMIGNAIYPKVAELIMKKIDYSKEKDLQNDRLELSA